MINKIAVITTALIAIMMGALIWLAFHFYGKTVEQEGTIKTVTEQKEQAEFTAKTQATAFNTFNTIAGATSDESAVKRNDSNDAQVIIRKELVTAPCAVVAIPDSANVRLSEHYKAIRSGSTSGDTGKPATTMPAITAAK